MADINGITIHTKEDYEGMRKAGRLAASVLDAVSERIEPGVTTAELDEFCHNMITVAGAIPAPLNYRGFPKSICTSVNEVVCHGIPNDKPLKDGRHGECGCDGHCRWLAWRHQPHVLGRKIPAWKQRITQVTYDAMMLGIEQVKPGARTGDIGAAIQEYAEGQGYSIVREYCGHGLGKVFHAAPNILHFGKVGTGEFIKEGMFFTVEPMLNAGKADTRLSMMDGWTVRTKDKRYPANSSIHSA